MEDFTLQGLSKQELYCELLRNCFLGLIDASGSQDELKWAAFTFLKVVQIFNLLCSFMLGFMRRVLIS